MYNMVDIFENMFGILYSYFSFLIFHIIIHLHNCVLVCFNFYYFRKCNAYLYINHYIQPYVSIFIYTFTYICFIFVI